MNQQYNIKFKTKTKYIRKFLNSLASIFLFILGFIPIFTIVFSYIYLFFIITEVTYRDDMWSSWLFFIYIPITALVITFGSNLIDIVISCWDKSEELMKK